MTTRPSLLPGLVVLLTIVLLALAGTLAYQFLAGTAAAREVAVQRRLLATTERQMAQRTRAQQASHPVQARIPTRPAAWSWSDQLPKTMAQLATVLEGSGAKLESMQPAPLVERGGVARFPLRVALKTELTSLTRILQRLRAASPVLAVDALTIHTGETHGEPLQVELTLSSYVLLSSRPTAGGHP